MGNNDNDDMKVARHNGYNAQKVAFLLYTIGHKVLMYLKLYWRLFSQDQSLPADTHLGPSRCIGDVNRSFVDNCLVLLLSFSKANHR